MLEIKDITATYQIDSKQMKQILGGISIHFSHGRRRVRRVARKEKVIVIRNAEARKRLAGMLSETLSNR